MPLNGCLICSNGPSPLQTETMSQIIVTTGHVAQNHTVDIFNRHAALHVPQPCDSRASTSWCWVCCTAQQLVQYMSWCSLSDMLHVAACCTIISTSFISQPQVITALWLVLIFYPLRVGGWVGPVGALSYLQQFDTVLNAKLSLYRAK